MKLKSATLILQAFFYSAKADCFDGNNFGCSHICSGSVCECPPCWTLGDDGKTCQFESGKALVTCTATGAEITLDKCAVPGVDASKIHLRDTSCTAVEENENSFKLTTGFSACGSTFGFSDEKLSLQNTMFIGHSIIDGRRRSREYEIDFSCTYNHLETVSTAVKASDTKFDGLTFDINSEQSMDFQFGFLLQFYRSSDFEALVTTGTFQPGSPLFGEVAAETSFPEELAFSVTKCKAEDKAVSQTLDFLNTCPVEGINFQFYPAQSASSKVKFSFESFVFQGSADDATIDVSCDIQICPQTSVECLQLCDPEAVSPVNILVILGDLSKSYITNEDGSSKKTVQLSAPSNDFTDRAKSAVVQGKLHLFGGRTDRKKIARLDACSLVELPYKLNFEVFFGGAALSISDNSEALICFDDAYSKFCDVFTGTNSVSAHSTTYSHVKGQLGFYNGLPTTVGSVTSDGYRKTETMTAAGWTGLADHPRNIYAYQLVGLQNGDLLMFGGGDRDDGDAYITNIWRLSNNEWTMEGNVQKTIAYGSAILHEGSIYVFPGRDDVIDDGQAVQRIDLTNNAITGYETIGNHDAYYQWPALFVTDNDYCV